MAEIDYNLLARKVADILKNDSQGVGEIPKVDSLEDVYSLPANRKRPGAEDEHEVVQAPMILLQQPALDAADVANTAADNADAKATLANTAANLANEKAALADAAANSVDESKQAALDAARGANAAKDAAVTATTDLRELESTVEGNEDSRKTAESARDAAEQTRETAETERETKEAERIASETLRVAAETERDTAETSRETAEATRQTAEEKRVSDFNEMQSNSEIATGAANASAASANQAAITANTAADNANAKATLADNAAANANDTANHPTYIGADHYVYKWNKGTKAYDKTDIYTKGAAFSIKKVYPSVIAMEADVANPNIAVGDFVLVNTNDVENPDNAQLYVKEENSDGSYSYSFLVDMSGAIGFTGKTPQLLVGTIGTSEAGSQAQITISEDGTDTDGNPKYRLNFVIPRGNPGAPFQVKGQYTTLEELQAAIPDGSTVEGFIAVGDKIPYDYYAWVNGAWVNQGKIVGEGGGKMVLIPSAVLNLTNTSTSNEILDVFGSKEAFIDIVRKVKEGAPAAINANGISIILSVCNGTVVESNNQYILNFILINPIDTAANFIMAITLTGDIATIDKQSYSYSYANIVNIPIDVWNLEENATSDEIIAAFGGKNSLIDIVHKILLGKAIAIISHSTESTNLTMFFISLGILPYTDDNNFVLILAASSGANEIQYEITLKNGIASLRINRQQALVSSDLVPDPFTGGTSRPASAEAVKVLNDTKVSSTNIRTIQKLTQAEYDSLSTKDNNTLYIIIN